MIWLALCFFSFFLLLLHLSSSCMISLCVDKLIVNLNSADSRRRWNISRTLSNLNPWIWLKIRNEIKLRRRPSWRFPYRIHEPTGSRFSSNNSNYRLESWKINHWIRIKKVEFLRILHKTHFLYNSRQKEKRRKQEFIVWCASLLPLSLSTFSSFFHISDDDEENSKF